MRTVTTTYEPVRYTVHRSITCENCNKIRKRQRTFQQTISPFNKDTRTGWPKTYQQVLESVRADAEAWRPTLCGTCEAER